MTESILPDDLLNDLAELSDSGSEPTKKPKLSDSITLEKSEILSSEILSITLTLLKSGNPPSTKDFQDQCNELLLTIDSELILLHKYLKDLFYHQFPELEDIVPSALDYANAITVLIRPEFTNKDLEKHLGNAITIAIATALIKNPITYIPNSESLARVTQEIFELSAARAKILEYVQHKISQKAPNLCSLLSPPVAANLLSAAGSLEILSSMPACNIQVLGLNKTTLPGQSNINKFHSYLFYSPFVLKSSNQKKAVRMLAGKAALAARIDRFQSSPNGETGLKLLNQIQESLEKSLEVDLSKQKRPLAVPSELKKPKRGGKRIKAAKKRFEQTEVRKEMNRVQFGVEAQEEFRDTGFGFGMLGKSGKILVKGSKNKHKISKKNRELAAGGTLSCFAFTENNEVRLENPKALKDTQSKYFESSTGFSTVLSNKKG